jgi:FkbM family methyltransferase
VAALRWGIYEKAERNYVRKYLLPELDVVELGASLGVITLEIIQKQSRPRKLVAIEANPQLIETLKKNIEGNCTREDVEIVNAAVDYRAQDQVPFSINKDNLVSNLDGSPAEQILVKSIRLREILQTYAITNYALVADIEGAEAGLIMNEADALRSCRQVIIELHKTTYDGTSFSVDVLADKLKTLHGFSQIASHGSVYVFEKALI